MDSDFLRPQKCATLPSRSALSALWMQTELGCHKYWASQDWLSVRCCRSRLRSNKILMSPSSSPSSSLCNSYFLSPGNWGTWCCNWGRPRSRGPKSSECHRSKTQFFLRCVQPWRRSAGLLRWSRCIWRKLLLSSFSLPPRTRRRRTSTLFLWCFLQNNWLKAVWVLRECSRWGSWQGLRLKCSRPEFLWGRAAWVWKSHSLSSAISALRRWDWDRGRN